jgi:hypothetical protein
MHRRASAATGDRRGRHRSFRGFAAVVQVDVRRHMSPASSSGECAMLHALRHPHAGPLRKSDGAFARSRMPDTVLVSGASRRRPAGARQTGQGGACARSYNSHEAAAFVRYALLIAFLARFAMIDVSPTGGNSSNLAELTAPHISRAHPGFALGRGFLGSLPGAGSGAGQWGFIQAMDFSPFDLGICETKCLEWNQ